MSKFLSLLLIGLLVGCGNTENSENPEQAEFTVTEAPSILYPSDIVDGLDGWTILLGNGETVRDLENYAASDYFYAANDGEDWVVFKTPNGGVTSPNSHNTRTELGEAKATRWTPAEGGQLHATVKVMHVSTSGDARAGAAYSVVVGQIHSGDGHENEPLKIFYKKFPGHTKGSVFWNYEINTAGDDNDGRWDYSTPVWGYDMATVGTEPATYPAEPVEGIALGEPFSYEVNVEDGVMNLTFSAEGHPTKTFTKSLIESDFADRADMPQQIIDRFVPMGQDGTERPEAYTGEIQFFKLGAYNQTNGRAPETNRVWSTGAETYGGDMEAQYANGSYTEVWFRDFGLGGAGRR